jgi:outer membrane protein assembly complex protein YaeT
MRRLLPVPLVACVAAACASPKAEAPEPEPDVRVELEGVTAFAASDLAHLIRNDLRRYAERPRETVLDDAAFRIAHRYETEGYAKVRIESEASQQRVLFRVAEGPRITVGRMHYLGNVAISDDELDAAVPKNLIGSRRPFSQRLLALQVEAVLAEYGRRGYIEAAVLEPVLRYNEPAEQMNITIIIQEGPAFVLERIEGAGPGLAEALAPLLGKPYTPQTPEIIEAAAIDHHREQGRLFAKARAVPRIDSERGQVTVALEIDAGSAARVGALRIEGAERSRRGFVQDRADLERGAAARSSDLQRAEGRLRETGLFRSVTVSPGAFQEDTGELAIDVRLEEKEPGEFALRSGYGSVEGIRFGADVAYLNLFGGGELVRAGGTVSAIGFRGDAEAALPWIFGTDFRPGLALYYEEQELPSFDVASWGAVPSLYHPIARWLSATGGGRYAVIRTDNVEAGVPPGDLLDFDYRALFVTSTLDLRDSALLTSRGFLLTAGLEWSPATLGSDIEFVKGTVRSGLYLPMPWEMVLAIGAQAGVIRPVGGTDDIPISLRFFAGGTTTVRGFEYGAIGPRVDGEPTGGEAFGSLQVEVRFPVWGPVHGAVFTDRGAVWFDRDEVDWDETRWSAGFGARYYTPAGAIVADLGWNPSREEDERAVEFHLSIGFPF